MSGAATAIRRRWRQHMLAGLFTGPGLVFLLLLFAWPVLRLLSLSVEGGTLAPYEKALTDGLYVRVDRKSVV